jgi:hypothetical protein
MMSAIMAVRRHPTPLTVLPEELVIVIAGHLAMTLERPIDDLRSLGVTCSSMCRICGDRAVNLHMSLDRVKRGTRSWNDSDNYYVLLASLTALNNPEACFLTRIPIALKENHSPRPCLDDLTCVAEDGHNVVAYVAALLLYRHNGDARDDDTARRYIRQVEEEESRAAAVDQRVCGYTTTGVCCATGQPPTWSSK